MLPQNRAAFRAIAVSATLGLSAISCGAGIQPPRAPEAAGTHFVVADRSGLCEELRGRFVGLPREDSGQKSVLAPPIAGRLWLRDCRVETAGGTVRLSLGGPGWYWLEDEKGGFRIHQAVTLDVNVVLTGEFSLKSEPSIVAVYFRPTADAQVSAQVTNHVDVEPKTLFAAIVDALPFALVSAKAQRQIGDEFASRFLGRLNEGATFTLNLNNGDSDIVIGKRSAVEPLRRPFEDGESSLANERQLLFPGGLQVLGPFEPADEMPFDVLVENGDGVVYQAACVADVERELDAVSGVPKLDPKVSRTSGRIQGAGMHHTSLTLNGCPWYLVTTGASKVTSLIALRLRPGFEPGWM